MTCVPKLNMFVQIQFFKDKNKIFMAKYFCVRLHTIFGAALAAGLVVARMIPRRLVAGGP